MRSLSPSPDSTGAPGGVGLWRFYSLDALRGCAALVVVFWHWHSFFDFWGPMDPPYNYRQQPCFAVFSLFYTNGWRAVDLFFCLSGFVFYWLYRDRVQAGKISGWNFAVLRFSRLYPLHFVTLLVMAVGMPFVQHRFETPFAPVGHDLPHFVLQLLLASAVAPVSGAHFNSPSWSISVEVFCYALFFGMCRVGAVRWWALAAVSLLGFGMQGFGVGLIGRGFASFFLGGLCFMLFERVRAVGLTRGRVIGFAVATLMLWAVIPVAAQRGWGRMLYLGVAGPGGSPGVAELVQALVSHAYEYLLFPATIVTLALVESWRGRSGRLASGLAVLGDLSYSSYLWHVPLQLAVAAGALAYGVSPTFFYTPMSLGGFMVVLLGLSWLSYRFLERPAQAALRRLQRQEPAREN